jgi:hypothetical protein
MKMLHGSLRCCKLIPPVLSRARKPDKDGRAGGNLQMAWRVTNATVTKLSRCLV